MTQGQAPHDFGLRCSGVTDCDGLSYEEPKKGVIIWQKDIFVYVAI